jgi:hypothetical protein
MRKMEVVVTSIQSTRNTVLGLGVLVRPIQSIPLVACPSHDPMAAFSLPLSKLDRSTGISECADNDHWALVRLLEGYTAGHCAMVRNPIVEWNSCSVPVPQSHSHGFAFHVIYDLLQCISQGRNGIPGLVIKASSIHSNSNWLFPSHAQNHK